MKNNPVIILGAGITGLSAAWYLEKKGFSDITILEAGTRAGGKIETLHEDGFLVEKGPDSFVITKPYATDLIKELGLEDELIYPKTNRFFILKDGNLVNPPKGLNMMVPTDLSAFLESTFFTWHAKHRILQESTAKPRMSQDDESFADFINRRFGNEMLDLYAGPLFTGIYATPAKELSMNAAFPQLRKMAQQYGSITRAIKNQPKPAPGASSRSSFAGLRNGMQTLSDTLIKQLKHTKIILNTKALPIESIKAGNDAKTYQVKTENGHLYNTDYLIVTLPSNHAKSVLNLIAPKASEILESFSSSSSRIVTLAYKTDKITEPLLATGYVSAETEKNHVSSATWLSSKWEGRAPEGHILLRCFMGKNPDTLTFTNDELIHAAHLEMSKMLELTEAPLHYWVQRWDAALPQYKVGHVERVEALIEAINPHKGLIVTGSYLNGVGLPDCIHQGIEAAGKISA